MPKKQLKARGGISKIKRSKHAPPTRRMTASHARLDDEISVDGCDTDFVANDATPDAELPAAKGGVETSTLRRRRP